MRRAARKDKSDTYDASGKILSDCNIDYTDVSQIKNFCDKLVYYEGKTYHVEFKTKGNATKAQKEDPTIMLEDGERAHMEKIQRNDCNYLIVWNVWELLERIGAVK